VQGLSSRAWPMSPSSNTHIVSPLMHELSQLWRLGHSSSVHVCWCWWVARHSDSICSRSMKYAYVRSAVCRLNCMTQVIDCRCDMVLFTQYIFTRHMQLLGLEGIGMSMLNVAEACSCMMCMQALKCMLPSLHGSDQIRSGGLSLQPGLAA